MDQSLQYEDGVEGFAHSIAMRVRELITNDYDKLSKIWTEVWSSEEKQAREKILETNLIELFTNFMAEIINKEYQMKDEFVVRIEDLLEEIKRMEQGLGIKVPFEDVQNLPLQSMAKQLNQKAQGYRELVEARVTELRELKTYEKTLLEALGSGTCFDIPEIPTEAQLEQFQHHVQSLETEKFERMGIFMEKRQKIVQIFQELGTKPTLLFEKNVAIELDERDSPFQLTNENMEELDQLLVKMEAKALAAQERREDMFQTLSQLWSYLEEAPEHQEDFLARNRGYSQTVLAAFENELDRCKKEKSANIGKFIERIRQAIVAQWDKCMVSDATRDQFRGFYVKFFNEDLYNLHELELARWQEYYSLNQRIFDLYGKQTALFEKLLELNGRGKSANRYHNRGGQLLQEEKQRKIVAKDLPRVEAELRSALDEFRMESGAEFMAFEKPLVQLLNEKWQSNFDQKTIDKFRDGAAASSVRTPLVGKRPATTSASTGGKVRRIIGPSTPAPPPAKPPRAAARRILMPMNQQHQEPDSTMNLESSYDEFTKMFNSKIGNRQASRSTEMLTPRKVLRERTQPSISTRSSPVAKTPRQHVGLTPKTVPRRGRAADQPKTPSRRLPCIL